jgi:adenylate kinase family enzyme
MNLNDLFNEEKVRLDPKCWTGKKIGNPKTKVKGGVRVNNCVPKESVAEGSLEEGVNDPHIFKAIAMIGPMGAGKSTIARQLVGGSGLRSLNLDNFNELLIKQGKVVGGNLTPDQLERSWQLTQAQKGNWVDGRLGLLIDGSGRNVEGLVKPLLQLEALGYDTMVILVNVSLETSLQRQQSRAAQQAQQYGTGRNVPADLAKSSYDQIQQNIPKLQQLYGNKLLIINNEGAVDLTQEKTIVDRFLSAPPSKPAAVEWIKSQGASQGQQLDKRLAQQQRQQSAAQRAPTYTQQGMAEGVMYGAENLHVGDDVVISGDVELKGATGVIDSFGQDKRFVVVDLYNHGRHSFHSSDVSANDYDNDEHDDLDETRRGQIPMTLNPGETDNLEPENLAGFRALPAYKQGQAAQQKAGKQLIQKSPYTFQSDQDWAYRQGAFDTQQAAMFANFGKSKPLTTEGGEQQKGADYRDPPEDKDPDQYGDDYQAMVARVKKLAGLGPMKTVYDPNKRVYKNVPTADQPKR